MSALSVRVERDLLALGLLGPSPVLRRHRLSDLTVERQSLPEVDAAVLRRLDRLEVDGLLGLGFLQNFEAVHFYTRTLRLVLE